MSDFHVVQAGFIVSQDERKHKGDRIIIYFKTEVGSGLADETERCSDMNLQDNIKSVVWHSMCHLVECEPGIIHNVVNFAPFSI